MLKVDLTKVQARAWNKLKRALSGGRIAHAYLFQGPSGVGREQAAILFAASLNCHHPGEEGVACGECAACRKIARGNHPNLHILKPDGSSIKLQQFKQLKKELSLRRVEEGCQVVIIAQAERMTDQAANSILKILEDPPEDTVFILMIENIFAVLPTILSRCQKVSFQALSVQERSRALAEEMGMTPHVAAIVLQLGGGNVEKVRQLLEKGILGLREQVLDKVEDIKKMNQAQLLFLAEEWAKENTVMILQVLLLWCRDLLVWQETETESLLVNQDKLDRIKRGSGFVRELQELADLILATQQAVVNNANKRLAMENMLLKWAKVSG